MMDCGERSTSRYPFTASQREELEQQSLAFRYIVSGAPIPQDLIFTVQRSMGPAPSSAFLLHHPHLGWSSGYHMAAAGYGLRKMDPEPGRCRRTDGKKWRCSKDAYRDSKYCERHMHRGRNRSRKPVEAQSLSPAASAPEKNAHFLHTTRGNALSSVPSETRFMFSTHFSSTTSPAIIGFSSSQESTDFTLSADKPYRKMMGDGYKGESHDAFFSMKECLENERQRGRELHVNNTGINLLGIDNNKIDEPKKMMHHFLEECPPPPKQEDISACNINGGSELTFSFTNTNNTLLSISAAPNSLHDFFTPQK